MQYIAFDVETPFLKEHESVQQIVCASMWDGYQNPLIYARDFGLYQATRALLENDNIVLIGHNMAFDMCCVFHTWPDLFDLVFEKYDKLLVECTMIREALYAIARGYFKEVNEKRNHYFGLKSIVDRRLGRQMEKGGIQLKYEMVDGYPIEQYPAEFVKYSLDDSIYTWKTFEDQNSSMLRYFQIDHIPNARTQSRAYFHLYLSGKIHGITTDAAAIDRAENRFQKIKDEITPALLHWGIIRDRTRKGKKAGTIDKKRIQQIVSYVCNGNPDRTDPTEKMLEKDPDAIGNIKTDKETLDKIDYPILNLYKKYNWANTYINTFIGMLRSHNPIFIRYWLADTGRTTTSPNIQNQPRKYGIRECYIPRPGNAFINADYAALEMCTFAQILLWIVGKSRLADAINGGLDPHLELTRNFPHINLDYPTVVHHYNNKVPEIKNTRQIAKHCNFGFAGGMGPPKFIEHVRKLSQGEIVLTLEESRTGKNTWLNTWPEANEYFSIVGRFVDQENPTITQFISGRIRGLERFAAYTQCCNTLFQGLAIDGAKEALNRITKACYYDRNSPLYGFRINAFIHDEFLAEGPADRAPEACEEMARLMIEGMKVYVPDVDIKTSMAVSDRWYKEAEELRDNNGRLLVYSENQE